MIQFREISVSEALDMIANDQLKNLYFRTRGGQIDCVTEYKVDYTDIAKRKYFKMENIK